MAFIIFAPNASTPKRINKGFAVIAGFPITHHSASCFSQSSVSFGASALE
jgi:hypothetical protein